MNSPRITSDSAVDLIFHLSWRSQSALHTDGYQASRVNIWRDILPPAMLDQLIGRDSGERLQVPLPDGAAVAAFSDKNLFAVKSSQFGRLVGTGKPPIPHLGRFYPKGMLRDVSGVFRENMQPFRCVGLNNGHMTVDFNHPLAGKPLQLSVVVGRVETKRIERGGTSVDWMETLTSGPGMQARWRSLKTEYFDDAAFEREDSKPDELFYRAPRLVHHIDDNARAMVSNTYGRFLTDGMNVLDLMSSWESHVPGRLQLDRFVGLGLNETELRKNPMLREFVIHDLNADAALPFDSNTFDAVINTVSVEYLVDPLAVFSEVSRVLRPDGCFVVTFSNRWFPAKAIRIWSELHEFERMGLVLEYFLRTGSFKNLQTYSIRGVPRPHDDKYYPDLPLSDPVYAVWGRKA